eukprot:11058931-Alexandrium_andersonii.AAC.1
MAKVKLRGATNVRRERPQQLPERWEAEDYEEARNAASIALTDPSLPPDPRCRVQVALAAATQA